MSRCQVQSLVKLADGVLKVIGGEHKGKTVEQVCQENPSWCTWLRSNTTIYLTNEEYNSLVDLMEKYDVPMTKQDAEARLKRRASGGQ